MHIRNVKHSDHSRGKLNSEKNIWSIFIMSLAVFLKEATGLRGHYDRIAKLTFRNKTLSSNVYEFCSDAFWEEEFDWKVDGPLKALDSVEIQIYNYKIMRNKLIAHFQIFCKRLLDDPWMAVDEYLVDNNNTVINSKIALEIMYVDEYPRETPFEFYQPKFETVPVLEDWELESRRSSRRNSQFSLTGSLRRKLGSISGSITSSKRAALIENGEIDNNDLAGASALKKKKKDKGKVKERFNLHPKVRVKMKPQREEIDFMAQIRIIEGKNIAGTQLDPVLDVYCFGEVKSTQVKEQTNNPFWDEFFVFNKSCQREFGYDELIEFRLYTGRNLISKGTLLGTFKIDIGMIYHQPDHRFIRKYACITHPDESLGASGAGIKGYVKMDLTVLATGDPVKEPPTADDDDVDSNPLLPDNVKPERLRNRLVISIFRAEGLPKMNSGILANIRKAFSGEAKLRDLADPFVTCYYAGLEVSSSVIPKCYDPEWIEQITFCDLFPSLCRRLKIQLRDKDVTKNETIGTFWIDLSEISNNGCNVHKFSHEFGFTPTFGPTWVNFYGSTRDFTFIDQNNFLNEGLEEGIGYRGRLLLSVRTEEGESASNEEVSNVDVRGAVPISDLAGGKEEMFQLFCCIFEASMIDSETASKPIRFEMNIGNFGNTFDGKMISFKDDDDDDDEEEDLFMKPLTKEFTAPPDIDEYISLPFEGRKPTMAIRFDWEDQRRRCYLTNIMDKYRAKLDDELEDVDDRINIDADDTYEYLQDALREFIKYSNTMKGKLKKITGAKAGVTLLDNKRVKLCEKEVDWMKNEAQKILDSIVDNERIRNNYSKVLALRDKIAQLSIEPQTAMPDVFIWLLSGRKRMSYVRIPPHHIMYSPIPYESGKDAGKLQTYLLSLPGKSGLGEAGWAVQCKLTCMIWLGVLKNKKDMLIEAPEEYQIPKMYRKSTAPPPPELIYKNNVKLILRSHLYQARGLIGSDDSGLSDAFCRVIFTDQHADTRIIFETRSPTWNQMLIFYNIVLWGDMDSIVNNPPTILAEIFDYDEGGEIEFIGRAMARPLVKRAEQKYEGSLFPPKLEWFQIYRGDNPAGELLAAFELLQIAPESEEIEEEWEENENRSNLPLEELIEEYDDFGEKVYFAVPENIQPTMAMHTIECLFWGVREMKKIDFQAVEKPQVTMDCIGSLVSSTIMASAKKNPNFESPWARFDLLLPSEDRYCPPLTISVREKRWFGNEILIGTAIVNSLLKYLQDPSKLEDSDMAGEAAYETEAADGGEPTPSQAVSRRGSKALSMAGSKAGSKAPSVTGSKAGSKAPSLAGSKAGSKAPSLAGSKAGSKILSNSIAASRARSKAPSVAGTVKSVTFGKAPSITGSKIGYSPGHKSILKTPAKTPLKTPSHTSQYMQHQTPRRSHSRKSPQRVPVQHIPTVPASMMASATKEYSSKINYYIRSNPGSTRKTPLKKKSPSKMSETRSYSKLSEEPEPLTPFKKLMDNKKSPSRKSESGKLSIYDHDQAQSLLGSLQEEEITSEKKNLIDKISTPIRSIGSKLATPIQSVKNIAHAGSKAGSNTGSRASSRGRLTPEDIENIELHVGAEASDFYDEEIQTTDLDMIAEEIGDTENMGGGDGADTSVGEKKEIGEPDESGEPGEGAEEASENEKPASAEAPVNLPGDDENEGEEEDEEEVSKKPEVKIGEDELKAQEEALAAEAEEEGEGEEKEEKEDDEDNEDQVDWWSRFYEVLKDVQRADEEKALRIKKRKRECAKKGIAYNAEEEEEEDEGDEAPKPKKIINPKIIRLKIYKTELEEVEAFDGFNDILHSFTLLRGKSNGNDDDDESRIYGKFKGAIKVWKHPLPPLFFNPDLTMGSFKMLPSMDPLNILCRIYVVKGIDLSPTDLDGKADPFVQVKIGKHLVKDKDNYVAKNLNPAFGRVFDLEVMLPHDNMLTVGVYDYDLVGTDDLIGETKIDIENRFFSKHRATCGMSIQYAINGFNKWRDPIKPTAILQRLCRDHKLKGPTYKPGRCLIETEEYRYTFYAPEHIMDDMGNPKQSEEPAALKALHNFHKIDKKGYALVPEHVETRSLFSPDAPGIEQGRIQLWVDLFDMEGPSPGPAVDITPRKPTSFELRVIIWNTEEVTLGDINILTGQPCADIYVKGWIEGLKGDQQNTDVHGSSLTGEGNFNWRFIFPFKYHKAEDKVVIIKKASLFSWDATEEKIPGRLILQCWDSDALSSDDFLGDTTLNLNAIPRPSKTSQQCKIETMENENKDSIFKKTLIKGWWPFILDTEDAEPEIGGKVEAELQLLTEQQAEEDPAGKGRKEPNPLPFPNRPDIMMEWMMNPLKALRYFLWEQYKFCFAKFLVIAVLFAIMGLFFYSMPGFLVKKLFGA